MTTLLSIERLNARNDGFIGRKEGRKEGRKRRAKCDLPCRDQRKPLLDLATHPFTAVIPRILIVYKTLKDLERNPVNIKLSLKILSDP
jgi:hypothetical protein